MTELSGGRAGPRTAELLLAAGIALLGVGLRLVWIRVVPTNPVSDFASVLDFAAALARDFVAPDARQWFTLSPGASLVLSFGIRAGVAAPVDTARFLTAVVAGLVPLIPVLAWRDVVPRGVRAGSALLLALWPGQVFFSGVVAQDSWAIVPSVALAALGVRWSLDRATRPVLAGALLGLGFLMRQELLVVLAPLALAGAGLLAPRLPDRRLAARFGAALGVILLLAAGHRWAGSGRFALTTTHGALAVLCATVPGSSWAYNAPPYSYLETYAPGADRSEVAGAMARREIARRPLYHAVRAFYFTAAPLFRSSAESLFWSLGPDTLPEAARDRGARLRAALEGPLLWEMRLVVWAASAALVLAIVSRNAGVLLIAVAAGLKVAVHAVTVSQPRYYYPVTALVLLALPVAVRAASRARGVRLVAIAAVAALPLTAGLERLTEAAGRYTRAHDEPVEYRFSLRDGAGKERVRCRTENAGIWAWSLPPAERPVSFFRPDPGAGDVAEVTCELAGDAPATLEVDVPSLAASGLVELSVRRSDAEPEAVDVRVGEPSTIALPLDPGERARATIRLRRTGLAPEREVGHAATATLRLRADDGQEPAALLAARPNPIPVCDATALGETTLTWTAPPETLVEVRVGSVRGELFWPASRGGERRTGKSVADGTEFLLVVPASAGVPARVAGKVLVRLTRDGCP